MSHCGIYPIITRFNLLMAYIFYFDCIFASSSHDPESILIDPASYWSYLPSLSSGTIIAIIISSIWIPVAPYFLPVTLPRMLADANTTLFHVDTPIPLFTGIAAVMLCGVVRCEHSPHVNCDLEEQHEPHSHNTLLTTCPIGLYQALL